MAEAQMAQKNTLKAWKESQTFGAAKKNAGIYDAQNKGIRIAKGGICLLYELRRYFL